MFSAALRQILDENSRLNGALGSSESTSRITRPASGDAVGAEGMSVSVAQQSRVPMSGGTF